MNFRAVLLIAATLVPALTGCVVSQTRGGQYQFGFIDPGTTVAHFHSSNGAVRLRRHLDGTWGLRFSDKLTVYKMGAFDGIRLMETNTVGGQTAALFERRRNGCVDYELLTITDGNVDKYPIRPGCNSKVEAGLAGDRMVIREDVIGPARFWIWSPLGVERGRERPAATTRPGGYRPIGATPPPRPSTARVSHPPSAAPVRAPQRPPEAPVTPITVPAGAIETEVIQPTRVVLVRDGA